MNRARPLTGRTALVTGAGVGIGRAVALALAAAGAKVAVHYYSSIDEGLRTAQEVEKLGGGCLLFSADLSVEKAADSAIDRVADAFGRLDILVNNAGSLVDRSPLAECPTELWRKAFAVNVDSAFFVTRRAIPWLKKSGHGAIVNVLSLSVQTGGAGGAGPYAAAKGALEVMTRTLAKELAPEVRVNAVMPGVVETRHHEQHTAPERMEEYRKQTPLGRNGRAEEVAQAVLFLAGDSGSFVTGSILDVNGGRFMR